MYRRQYLTTGGLISSIFASGCTSLKEEKNLGRPTEEREDQSIYHIYEDGGKEIVVLSFIDRSDESSNHSFRLLIDENKNVDLNSIYFKFRLEINDENSQFYLRPPRTQENNKMRFYHQNSWTVLEVSEFDDSKGTTGYDLLAPNTQNNAEASTSLDLDYEIILSKSTFSGNKFIAENTSRIELI